MTLQSNSPSDTAWDRSIKEARARFAQVDPGRLRDHVQRASGAAQVTVVDLQTLTEGSGMSNGIGFFTAVLEGGGQVQERSLVLRYAPGVSLIRQKSFADEYLTLQAAAAAGLPTPTAFWPDLAGETLGVPGFIMDRVDADAIPSAMYTSGPIAGASPAQRKEMMLQAAGLQAQLRRAAIGAEKAPHLLAKGVGSNAIERELSWWMREAELAASKDDPGFKAVRALYDWMVSHIPPARPATLTHGDGQICNIMYRDGRACCWLDWELAYLGHQESDLMMIMMTTELTKTEGVHLEGLPTEDEYIARYEAESGCSLEYWEYFSLLMVFRYCVGMLWIPDSPHVHHVRPGIQGYLDRAWTAARAASRTYTGRA